MPAAELQPSAFRLCPNHAVQSAGRIASTFNRALVRSADQTEINQAYSFARWSVIVGSRRISPSLEGLVRISFRALPTILSPAPRSRIAQRGRQISPLFRRLERKGRRRE
jgi:hypothetical protein